MSAWILGGRVAAALGVLALLGAWLTQMTGSPLLGMRQEHLFADAAVLLLLAIFLVLDGRLHLEGR